jgi:hypothetical protein
MIKDQEGKENKLNNSDLQINRGFELMLRTTNKGEEKKPKTFEFSFGKMFSIFTKKIHFNLNLFLDITQK